MGDVCRVRLCTGISSAAVEYYGNPVLYRIRFIEESDKSPECHQPSSHSPDSGYEEFL